MVRWLLAAAVAALVLASAADAAPKQGGSRLWATVNICNTAKHPGAIGIRASMPGGETKKTRLYMRFRVQWRDPADGLWHNVLARGDSGYVRIGRGTVRHESGQIFRYQVPETGRLRLRGKVDFQWRVGKRVVRHTRRVTKGGHRSTAGADPKRFSAAVCVLEKGRR